MPLHPNLPGIGVTPFKVGGGAAPAWSPASLPDLELWLSNAHLATIGDAQPIAQWDDASGLARHAVQATATSRPTARLTGDKWEAKGDGVDDWLRSTFGAPIAQPTTVWCVGSVSGNSRYAFDGIAGGARQWLWRGAGGLLTYAAPTQVTSLASDSLLHYFVAIFNGASSSLLMDGVEIAAGNPGTEGLTGLTLFANLSPGAFNAGVIRDAGACSSILAGDDRANLLTYLASLV